MIGFINLLVNLVPSILRNPARWIADRIASVFVDGVKFAKWLKVGFIHFERRVLLHAVSLVQAAGQITATFYWLAKLLIPKSISSAVTGVRKYILDKLHQEIVRVKSLIAAGLSLLWTSVNVFRALYDLTVAWIKRKLSEAFALLRRIVDQLFGVLGTPQRMAEWLVGALWGAIFRHVYAHRDRIASWFLRSSGAFAVWFVRELERVLVRIL